MTFLSWQAALIVGAIAVPLLLLLYFLKLRRQERKVSSTLLWKRTVHDLQVNAPFQKLRRNLLLFLQLLILAALLFAIANPVVNLARRPGRNTVVLLDRSASMKTVEADGRTRLEHAKDAAIDLVSNLPDDGRAMVISFADRADVVSSFTDNQRRLAGLIQEIEPTDAPTKIGEALQLAVAYSASLVDIPGVTPPGASAQGAADIELFSDGRIADAGEEFVTRGQMRYHRVGAAADNVGITAFGARRDYERPGLLTVLATVQNFGPRPLTLDVSVEIDGAPISGSGSIREVTLGPAPAPTTGPSMPAEQAGSGGSPSSQNVIFELYHEAGGVLQVRLHHEDALAVDNLVSVPIDPPRQVRVLVVADRDPTSTLLLRGLRSIGVEDVTMMGSREYEQASDEKMVVDGRSAFDLVLLDRHSTDRLPPGNYLFFGGIPRVEGIASGEDIEGQVPVLWKEDHPLMRNVPFEGVFVAKWARLTAPTHAVPLVEGEDSTVMAFITEPGHRYIIGAFDLVESNFLWEPAFVIFLQNTLMFLAGTGLLDTSHLLAPGDTLSLDVPPGADEVRLTRPDGAWEDLDARGRQSVTYAKTHATGVYRARFNDRARTEDVFAVNIADPVESLIQPNEHLTVGAAEIASLSGEAKVSQSLWPHATAAALLLLLLEWWVYNKRVMI